LQFGIGGIRSITVLQACSTKDRKR